MSCDKAREQFFKFGLLVVGGQHRIGLKSAWKTSTKGLA